MLELMKPIKPMLCRYWFIQNLLKSVDSVACEIKYNGIRVMVHKKGEDIRIFTRWLKDITNDFSYILPNIQEALPCDVIIDCELVSTNFGEIIPAITHKNVRIEAKMIAFDILHLDGKDLVGYQLYRRRSFLKDAISENESVQIIDQTICNSIDEVKEFFIQAAKGKQEGIVVKRLDSEYYIGQRPYCWVKAKPRRD